jgi:RNA-directed DNA polymerase
MEIGVSLHTPDSVRRLQRALYVKAKQEPEFRFYLLYDKVCRDDVLTHAYRLSREARGAAGADGVEFADIEAVGVESWLTALRKELRERTYRPAPVRRVMIPKPGGGERPFGIPTIRDRVVQTAVKLALEPIFEADFEDSAYGYRPRRSAQDAVRAVHAALCEG